MHQGSDPMVNTDAKKSTTRGMGESTIRRIHALPENFEIRCPRLAKNAIQHLLHHSIVEHIYTPYRTIKMVAFIIAFLRSWCEFSSESLLLSELLQFFLSCMGKYFLGTQKHFWDQWSDTFSTPGL